MFFRVNRGKKAAALKSLFLSLVLAVFSSAATIDVPASVTISSPGGGVIGTEQWELGASLTSVVTFDAGLYKYEYTWSEPDKDISHIIIEFCLTLVEGQVDDLLSGVFGGDVAASAADAYTSSSNGNSNPGLIGTLRGLKMDFDNNPNTTTFGFVTTLAPVIGRMYAKSGRDGGPGGGDWVYANGSGIYVPGCDNCRPDETPVPEPSAMGLMGMGLLGAGFLRSRRNK